MSNKHDNKNNILYVTLPIPPGINEQYATVNGHRVSTAVARRFKQEVKQKLSALEREKILNEELLHRLRQGYLSLLLAFYFETPLKRDLDGGLKIAQFFRVGARKEPTNSHCTLLHCVLESHTHRNGLQYSP